MGKPFGPLGQTGPSQIATRHGSFNGLYWMANALEPLIPRSDNAAMQLPKNFPQPTGFNGILLNQTAVAFADVPFPVYIHELQNRLPGGDFCAVTATVNATVAVYDSEVENHRTIDDGYWEHWNWTEDWLRSVDLGNGPSLGLFQGMSPVTSGHTGNQSWAFLSIYDSKNPRSFPRNTTQFSIKRHRCEITWLIKLDVLSMWKGSCDPQPLDPLHQRPYTANDLGLPAWYVQTLLDYLGDYSDSLYQSSMKVTTFTAVVSAMYWSRTIAQATKSFDLDYLADSHVKYQRRTMNTPTALYVVLVCQPVLILLMIVATLALHKSHINRGFGMITILAGVKTDTLKFIKGVSFSGRLT